ncbi:hypothetical protein MMC22_003444 [Lobaria immixta]|nr:hypothetical protein [Lobaria immixta]
MLMDRITGEIGWDEKVFNDEITNNDDDENDSADEKDGQKDQVKSENAVKNMPKKLNSEGREEDEAEGRKSREITTKMSDWCFAELRYKAELLKKFDCVESLDQIFKSDTIISNDLSGALINSAAPLENVPAQVKDWHPGFAEKFRWCTVNRGFLLKKYWAWMTV